MILRQYSDLSLTLMLTNYHASVSTGELYSNLTTQARESQNTTVQN